jgi:hypothetical protein
MITILGRRLAFKVARLKKMPTCGGRAEQIPEGPLLHLKRYTPMGAGRIKRNRRIARFFVAISATSNSLPA